MKILLLGSIVVTGYVGRIFIRKWFGMIAVARCERVVYPHDLHVSFSRSIRTAVPSTRALRHSPSLGRKHLSWPFPIWAAHDTALKSILP